ncbi:MAG: ABC transporter permease [Pseudomonadota bacterium]
MADVTQDPAVVEPTGPGPAPAAAPQAYERPSFWTRLTDNDIAWSFFRSPTAMIAAAVTVSIILLSFAAPLVAPFNPFDPAQISLWDGKLPPAWAEGGQAQYLLGTDNQGRDMLSTILYGGRLSIIVGLAAVCLGMVLGVMLGVVSGYMGGAVDAAIMRVADVQLTIPGILLAILINGIARSALPPEARDELAIYVVILAIGLTDWPQFARVVRGATLVESQKEYVMAARVIGLPSWLIMVRHVLPNVMRPVLVLATIGLALAIIAEATLSFLGQGIPPTTPSLGTLIRVGNEYLFSGLWWITFFPAIALVVLVFAVNLLGDWMRDALNPKLR